ncbi:MAG: MerR family transcriptional regulator [Bacteroidia bacterium]|nr:MerR family transcriptional regulator [Bacteroidia bacterium]
MKAMAVKFSIKDLERLSGVKAHTLRIWEQRYELLQPRRTSTNIRYYNNEDLKKILNVSLLNSHGYKISSIAGLTNENLSKEAGKLLHKFENESDQIEGLMVSLLDWDEAKFEETIKNAITHFGLENTIEKIVFPFLRQLGNMWQVGVVSPAQEHFISNLIRQKIVVEIDKLGIGNRSAEKLVMLFLPNNELHEMGLLYAHYLCRKKGLRCLYLGQSVPFDDLLNVYASAEPDILITILTSCFNEEDTIDFLNKSKAAFGKSKMYISGRLIVGESAAPYTYPSHIKPFKDFDDFKHLL